MTLRSLGLLASGHVAGALALRYLHDRAAVLILPGGDVPPIRTIDDIDRSLGYALRTRESLHARGFRMGEAL